MVGFGTGRRTREHPGRCPGLDHGETVRKRTGGRADARSRILVPRPVR